MSESTANNLGFLLRSFEGMRNWRALVLMIGGVMGAALVLYGGSNLVERIDSSVMSLVVAMVSGLLALLLFLAGVNGAGLLLKDQIDHKPCRGLVQAFFGGIGCTMSAVAALILLALGLLLLWIVLAALTFLDRIPGIGPFFAFLLSGPTAVVFAFCFVFLSLGLPLMYASIWRGHGAIGAIGRAVDIVMRRPLETFVHFLVLGLIVFSAAAFAFGMLFWGSMVTFSMHALVGIRSGLSDMSGGFGGMGQDMGGGGLTYAMESMIGNSLSLGAAGLSIGLAYLLLFALMLLIYLAGSILVHDSLEVGVEAGTADRMRTGLQDIKRKIDENRPRATPSMQSPPSVALRCPACGGAMAAGDVFCGNCGHRM